MKRLVVVVSALFVVVLILAGVAAVAVALTSRSEETWNARGTTPTLPPYELWPTRSTPSPMIWPVLAAATLNPTSTSARCSVAGSPKERGSMSEWAIAGILVGAAAVATFAADRGRNR